MATNFVWRGGGWADVGLLVMITVVVVVVASATAAAACRRCFCHYCSCLCFVRLRLISVKGCKLLDQYQSFLHEIYSLSIFTTKNLPYVGPGEY